MHPAQPRHAALWWRLELLLVLLVCLGIIWNSKVQHIVRWETQAWSEDFWWRRQALQAGGGLNTTRLSERHLEEQHVFCQLLDEESEQDLSQGLKS